MNSDSFMILFDVIILGYGMYMVYSAYQMRKTHQPPSMLINQSELIGARDVKGFCEAMFKPFVLFGVMAAIYGIVGLINDLYVEVFGMNVASVALFLILCFWFFKEMKKNKSKFLK